MFKLGTKVKVKRDFEDNYPSIKGKVLIIDFIATSTNEHPGYDEAMYPMALYDLVTEDGFNIDCSLYEYELEKIYKN